MRSELSIPQSDGQVQVEFQPGDAFVLPRANLYGICNSHASASFLDSASNECSQVVDLQTECETKLNPKTYTDFLKVYSGQATGSSKISVTTTESFSINAETLAYTPTSGVTASSVTSSSGALVSCSGSVKEVAYTVFVSKRDPDSLVSKAAYLAIDSITASIVTQASPLEAAPNTMTSV